MGVQPLISLLCRRHFSRRSAPISFDVAIDWDRCFKEMEDHGIGPVLYHQLKRADELALLPEHARARWAELYYAALARDAADRRLLRELCTGLEEHRVSYALFKGAALALGVYENGALRPRTDTDVLCAPSQWRQAERALKVLGYEAIPSPGSPFLLGQKMFVLRALGQDHVVDLHSSLSARKAFSGRLPTERVLKCAARAPLDGGEGRVLDSPFALLMACLHPLLHHPGDRRLIWEMDMVLIANQMNETEGRRFAELAEETNCYAAVSLSLERAFASWGLEKKPSFLAGFDRRADGGWLLQKRTWKQDLLLDLRALGFGGRVRLLWEVLVPPADYLLRSYGKTTGGLNRLLIPFLLIHRAISGARRRLA